MSDDTDEELERLWHNPQILFEAKLRKPKERARDYPFSIPSVRKTNKIVMHPRVTFFVGENGSGNQHGLRASRSHLGFALKAAL